MNDERASVRTPVGSRAAAPDRPLLTAAFAAALTASLALTGIPAAVADTETSRLTGTDRFDTAAQASRSLADPPRVFVATGRDFPDSLSGGAVAAHEGSPVLLVDADRVPDATAAELSRLGPAEIIVLGGTSAIGPTAVAALESYAPVTRWSGADRYTTSAVVSRASVPPGVDTLYVASGEDYPDALAAGAVAGAKGSPVLLVRPGGIPGAVRTELQRLEPDRIIIVGGPSSINSSVERDLHHYSDVIRRFAGEDRYATSVQLTREAFTDHAATVYLASGEDFPDALAGAPAARAEHAPVLLVRESRIPQAVGAELARLSPERVVALGGSSAISDRALREARVFAGTDAATLRGDGDRVFAAPSASLDHLQRRAEALNSHDRFIDEMMPALYEVAVRYDIDPTVMIAQSHHETGGGHFTRAVTPAHHNTCGLKVRDPGGLPDDHPDAHAEFSSWEEGATAHAQHLYAYAGRELPPGEVNVDPRWDWVYGRHHITVMTGLGTWWAPSPTYGDLVRNRALQFLAE